MEAVAVYSDADADAQHVRMADVAVRLGPAPPTESYLRIDAILAAAAETGAEAIHPGIRLPVRASRIRPSRGGGGPRLRRAVAGGDRGARRQDPGAPSRPVRRRGRRSRDGRPGRRSTARMPCRRSSPRPSGSASRCSSRPRRVAAGGACAGSSRPTDSRRRWPRARPRRCPRSATASVFLEREVRPARHIEVQLLGDATGQVVAIGERDCSIQRRHQKLVEEAPAPGLTVDERRRPPRPGGPRRHGGRAPERRDGGVPPGPGRRVLLPRGQHPAPGRARRQRAGRPASTSSRSSSSWRRASRSRRRRWPRQSGRPSPDGHAIEVRLSAEDPARDFAPGPGRIRRWVMPAGPGVRVDTGRRGRRPRPARLRQPGRQDHGPRRRTGPPPSTGCGVPSTRPRWPASRRPCRSIDSSPATPGSGPASCRSTGSPTSGTARPSGPDMQRRRRGGGRPRRCRRRRRNRSARPARRAVDRPAGGRRMGGCRQGRRRRSVARMSRLRVTDAATGELLAEVDTASAPARTARPRGRAPGGPPRHRPSHGPRQHPGRGRHRRLALRAGGRGRRLADLRARATRRPDVGRPPRPDRRSCHHPGTRRVGGGEPRRCRRGRPAAPRGGGHEDGERAARAPGRGGRAGRGLGRPDRSSSATRWSSSGDTGMTRPAAPGRGAARPGPRSLAGDPAGEGAQGRAGTA